MKKPQQSGELLVPRVIALLTKNTMFSYLISGFFFLSMLLLLLKRSDLFQHAFSCLRNRSLTLALSRVKVTLQSM